MKWTSSLVLAALVFVGCADDSEGSNASLGDYISELGKQADLRCSCYEARGYTTRAECRRGAGEVLPGAAQCLRDAVDKDEKTMSKYFDCLVPVERAFTKCVDDRLDCGDAEETEDACIEDYNVGAARCERQYEIASKVARELAACRRQDT